MSAYYEREMARAARPVAETLKWRQPRFVLHKACACGARFDKLGWSSLRLVGVQSTPADDEGPAQKLELRDCAFCGSTISVELKS